MIFVILGSILLNIIQLIIIIKLPIKKDIYNSMNNIDKQLFKNLVNKLKNNNDFIKLNELTKKYDN